MRVPGIFVGISLKGPLYSLIEGRLHYIVNALGEEQLFDPIADPWERRDLSGTDEAGGALSGLRAAVTAMTTMATVTK